MKFKVLSILLVLMIALPANAVNCEKKPCHKKCIASQPDYMKNQCRCNHENQDTENHRAQRVPLVCPRVCPAIFLSGQNILPLTNRAHTRFHIQPCTAFPAKLRHMYHSCSIRHLKPKGGGCSVFSAA